MITLSDARKFSEESPSIKRFKPWWEIVLDYIILALLLISLLAWARVTSVEASGLICIPRGKPISYGFVESRYANSRCSQEFETRLVLYYPYLLFLQWVVTFILQRTWLKIPVVITKLDAFHNIFCEIYAINPVFRRKKQSFRMLPELFYEGESFNKVKVLHDKLMFLLTERSYLLLIYRAKVMILVFLSFAFASGMVFWLTHIYVPKADIICKLASTKNVRAFDDLICNFSPAFFLYGIMCVNCFMLVLTMIFSCQGLYWTFKQKTFADNTGVFGQMIDHYTGLPGFNDLQFCMSLVHCNVRDGRIMFEVIKSCLRQEAQQLDERQKSANEAANQRSRDFEQEHSIVRRIAQELGLEIIDNSQDANHLFDCLRYIYEKLGSVELDFMSSTRDRLATEIQSNPLHFKSMIDNDPDQVNYDQFIKSMKCRDVYGNHYAIAAAANLYNVKIVVLHCQNTNENREVFEPYSNGPPRTTVFLAFTGPHYYQVTRTSESLGGASEKQVHARMRYANDEKYRHAIRQLAARSVERSEEGEYVCTRYSAASNDRGPSIASSTSIGLLGLQNQESAIPLKELHGLRRCKKKVGLLRETDPAEYV